MIWKRIFKKDRDNSPKQILILSFGCAGSLWLSQTLHKLPHVFCTMGVDHPIQSINYWHNKDEYAELLNLVKQGYFSKYGSNQVAANRLGLLLPPRVPNYPNIILDEALEASNHLRPNREFLINVHGLHVDNYLISPYAKQKNIAIYDLIRHPIATAEAWINVFMGCWENDPDAKKQFIERKEGNTATLNFYKDKYNIDFSDLRNLMSFFTFQHIACIATSFSRLVCKRIKFEDLKSNPDYFRNFYHDLFGSNPTDEYMDFVYSKENSSQGRISFDANSPPPLAPRDQYYAWSEDQRTLFSSMLDLDFNKIYKSYNYDFSFLNGFSKVAGV